MKYRIGLLTHVVPEAVEADYPGYERQEVELELASANTLVNTTMVTFPRVLAEYCITPGLRGHAVYDLDGKLLWSAEDSGIMDAAFWDDPSAPLTVTIQPGDLKVEF